MGIPYTSSQSRTLSTARVVAAGPGLGRIVADSGAFDIEFEAPTELGGESAPEKTNPIELGSAFFAGCVKYEILSTCANLEIDPGQVTVAVTNSLVNDTGDGYGQRFRFDIGITLPGLSKTKAEAVMHLVASQSPAIIQWSPRPTFHLDAHA